MERNKKDRTGETSVATNGMKMTIIAYRKNNDIDVRFEDGYIARNTRYSYFKKGIIKNPNKPYTQSMIDSRIGETSTATNGQEMTIIAYRNSNDIDVRFEDGYVSYHVHYYLFKKGMVKNPNKISSVKRDSRIGEMSIATNGQKITIIAYRNGKDIDVQFEDGYIAYNKIYRNFKKGIIKNPNKPSRAKQNSRIGETSIATNGQKMTIIAYRNGKDIDVQFEDGTIREKVEYARFKKGSIRHPDFPLHGKGVYRTFQTQYAYTAPNSAVYFYCTCQKCGFKKNLTARELINLNHKCDINGKETAPNA